MLIMADSEEKKMFHVHVCLISGQPIPNLLPLLQENPGKALFIVTPEMQDQAARLEKVARRRGVAVSFLQIASAYDYGTILEACEQVLT